MCFAQLGELDELSECQRFDLSFLLRAESYVEVLSLFRSIASLSECKYLDTYSADVIYFYKELS